MRSNLGFKSLFICNDFFKCAIHRLVELIYVETMEIVKPCVRDTRHCIREHLLDVLSDPADGLFVGDVRHETGIPCEPLKGEMFDDIVTQTGVRACDVLLDASVGGDRPCIGGGLRGRVCA